MENKKYFYQGLTAISITLIVVLGWVYFVYGTTIGTNITTADLTVSGNANTTGAFVVGGTLSVTGTSTFSGNVGVGTTTPAYKLDVVGVANVTGSIYEGGSALFSKYGVPSPSSMFPQDIGKNWKDLGVITTPITTATYLGNGIVIIVTAASNIVRSTDYGATWVDLGDFAAGGFEASVYLGKGIALLGHSSGDIYRSTDYGLTWTNLGTITGESSSLSYLGNGIAVVGDGLGDVYRSTDFGATWSFVQNLEEQSVKSLGYTDNGIVIAGMDGTGHIFRSIDYGLTWVDLGVISGSAIDFNDIAYLGNGVVIFGNYNGHIFRSADYGTTWTDLGIIAAAGGIKTISYIGNGIALAGSNQKLYRSADYGLTWQNLGNISSTGIMVLFYLGNGITIFGDWAGHVFRSDVSYKLDESQMGMEGSGSSGYIPRFTASKILATSTIYQSGSNVGIGTSTPSTLLEIIDLTNASTTVKIGSATNKSCLMMGDSDGLGVSYITVLNGFLSATDTKPAFCK